MDWVSNQNLKMKNLFLFQTKALLANLRNENSLTSNI